MIAKYCIRIFILENVIENNYVLLCYDDVHCLDIYSQNSWSLSVSFHCMAWSWSAKVYMAQIFWNFRKELTNTINVRTASLCWYAVWYYALCLVYLLLMYIYVYSAGVGCTETFIATDIEIQRIHHESLVDVYNSMCRLRFWRNFMAQTVVW